MAQEKILGNQLNLTDVATELAPYSPTNLITDTSPQLGGHLDTNGYNIITPAAQSPDDITIQSGATNTAGAFGAGSLTLTAGNATNTSNTAAGSVNLTAGNSYTGIAGDIILSSGDGIYADAGNISMTAGESNNGGGHGGVINIVGGYAGGEGSHNGGNVNITGGQGTNFGGSITLVGGRAASFGNRGGDILMTPGRGIVEDGDIRLHAPKDTIGEAVIQLWSDTDTGHTTGNYVALKAPVFAGSPVADVTFVLPELDGTVGEPLQTDGAGNLGFGTAPIALPTYTVSTLPVVVAGGMIYVSDATTGHAGSPASATGVQCFGRGTGSPAEWIDILTGLPVV